MASLTLSGADLLAYIRFWHDQRHRARTDLLWLCNEVLGYKDVSREVHGPILDALQQFPGAIEHHQTERDFAAALQGKVLFEPRVQMERLPPNPGFRQSRDTQYLYPRGHLKSTIITVAHTIQWCLNYPNVRVLLTTATEDLAKSFVIEIRAQFVGNEYLRQLFPDVCPSSKDGKVPELGNLGGFTLPCRDNTNKKLGPGGKEQTLTATTVGSSITGYHGDVLKNDDLVEKINSSSQGGIDDVIRHFGSQGDLLEKYNSDDPERPLQGWVDTVGTPWDFSDLYQVRRNFVAEQLARGEQPNINLVIRSAAPNWPDGPYLWPQRMGYRALKAIEDDPTKGPAQLSAQYLMNPIVAGQGLIDEIGRVRWEDELTVMGKLAGRVLRARMDLAGMDPNAKGSDNDYCALSLGAFSDGELVIASLRHGRPPAEEVVEWIFDLFRDWPGLSELVVERASGGSVVESWLRREMSERGTWLPVTFVTRTNRESKVTRIQALRPWFMARKLVLSSAIGRYRTMIEAEIKGFPKFRHDDILDTWSDLMVDTRGQVSGEVTQTESVIPRGRLEDDPLTRILAQMDRGDYGGGSGALPGYNPYTGFPA